ncbi:MAG: type II toxin-antitoxin system HicA family toxin [Acidaminococcaceae bacterium]|nr:type II toxin-antitoxin system HicA family toxin [Acidaminococcaceae bacterium]
MPRKIRDLIKLLKADGWYLVAQNGSHKQFKHPVKTGRVTIAGHKDSDDVPLKTEQSILRQAGLKK